MIIKIKMPVKLTYTINCLFDSNLQINILYIFVLEFLKSTHQIFISFILKLTEHILSSPKS